jgi:hypothetical protein
LYTAPTEHGETEDLWPSGIPPEIPLIKALTDDSNYLTVVGVAHTDSLEDIKQSVEMYIHTFVNEVYDSCIDRIPTAPAFVLPTLQRHNSNPSATNCEELSDDCFHLDSLYLRMNCPVTCGATSPLSGMFLNEARRGIPKALCQATQQYQDEWHAIPCTDLSRTELNAHVGWNKAWTLMLEFWDKRSTVNRQQCFRTVQTMFLNDGCNAVPQLANLACMADDYQTFCNDVSDILDVAHFCPVACGCVAGTNNTQNYNPDACPPSCHR